MNYAKRLERVLAVLHQRNLQGAVVSSPENIRYLSGFTAGADAWLFVSSEHCALITDSRYWEQAAVQCPNVELVRFRSHEDANFAVSLARFLEDNAWNGAVGFEGGSISFDTYTDLERALSSSGSTKHSLMSLGNDLALTRIIKESEEIALIAKAASIADAAWIATLADVKVGTTEAELASNLEWHMKRLGSSKTAFDTIVASGPNGAYPHALVTDRPIEAGELVTVDFGAVYQGYCSDMTRTFWLGELPSEQLRIWQIVKRAHDVALQAVRPGLQGWELDKIARDIITAEGYGANFNHSLGHGVGLFIHEAPGLRRESQTVLEPGMLVTIEPGIYVPSVGGCRIEDLVVVTDSGCQVLSHAPYQKDNH